MNCAQLLTNKRTIMSKDLKKFCKENGITLENCSRKGFYLLSWKMRPSYEQMREIIHSIREFGYDYVQDGNDSCGYFISIGKITLLNKRS